MSALSVCRSVHRERNCVRNNRVVEKHPMAFTYKAVTSVWVVIFGLVALSGSGTITGAGLVLLVLGGLVAPAIILSAAGKWRKVAVASATPAAYRLHDR
jgi:hypothetical protein